MRNTRFGLLLVLVVIASTLALYATLLRPWHMRWGASDEEIAMALPGDKYIPAETIVSTRAITINASPELVWSWLVQLGQGRGGYYSYEWLENLFAADMHNAEEIIPELQQLQVGDHISFQHNGPFAVVAEIEEGKMLALEGGWAWYLQKEGDNATRLVVRYASFPVNSIPSRLFYYPIFEPVHFVMEQGMLLGTKNRAENNNEDKISDLAEIDAKESFK